MQQIENLNGSLVALVTPMKDEAGDPVDYDALEELVKWHINEGTVAIVAAGTTGEAATLSFGEWAATIGRCCQAAQGNIPIVAGTGTNCTSSTVEKTRTALALGANAALVVVPYYNKPTQEGLYQHFKAVAASVPSFPIILYNVPGRTGCDLEIDTVCRLAGDFPNIVGIKEASGIFDRFAQLKERCRAQFKIYSGEDGLSCAAILAGAHGSISVTANVMPQMNQHMCSLALASRSAEAKRVDASLQPLHSALFLEPNPTAVKWTLCHMGKINGIIRLPLLPLSFKHQQKLQEALSVAQQHPLELSRFL